MKKLLMLLCAVKSVFTEYAKMRAYIFNDNFNRIPGNDIGPDWAELEESNNDVRPREAVISQLRDRDAGVVIRTISTLGFDGVFPQYERRGNTKRKPYNQKLYLGYMT